jgi:hypothetical protein
MRYLIKDKLFEILLEFSKGTPHYSLDVIIIKKVPKPYVGHGKIFQIYDEDNVVAVTVASIRFPEINTTSNELEIYLNGVNDHMNSSTIHATLWNLHNKDIYHIFKLLKQYSCNSFKKIKIL